MAAPSDHPTGIVALFLSPTFLPFVLIALLYTTVKLLNRTDIPKIKNLPEVPGVPLFGNLLQLGSNHAQVATALSKTYGPVFQVRLGNRRIVFANTFSSVRQLWITNQSALISRPTLHTFHTVVSSSEGFTIGTSPWDASCKARRKAAATALNRPAVQSYMPIIDYELTKSLKEILAACPPGTNEVELDPCPYFQRYALSTSLTLNYGCKIEGNIDDALLTEITAVERAISNFRSTADNWADYIPILRWLPGSTAGPQEFRRRRAAYMHTLLGQLKERIAAGTDRPCISGNVLKDPEAKLSDAEVMSIGLTMVSAGLDTVPANLIMTLAYLSSPHGQAIQQDARAAIAATYGDDEDEAWTAGLRDEKCAYIVALVKETLRFWSVIPICLPRVNTREIIWEDPKTGKTAKIPAGTSFYMNAYGAHYDEEHFGDPFTFRPERYLSSANSKKEASEEGEDGAADDNPTAPAAATHGTPHYGYGAGSRMCIGSHLANRELYLAFLRIFLAFDVLPPQNCSKEEMPVLDAFGCNLLPNGLTMDPRPFKIRMKVRDRAKLERWIRESEARTVAAGL